MFLALKWAIAVQFQEYLCWKLFVVKMDNNPLTYILTTPNFDTTHHHWVEMLAGFTFSIEYQKGRDNVVADALSCVVSKLNAEAVKAILDGVTVGTAGRADAHDLTVAEADERIQKQVEETAVQVQATHMCVNLHVMDWVAAQQEDPILKIVMEWISSHKVPGLKHLLGDHAMTEEGMAIFREQEKFMLHQGALYHWHTLARELEEAMWFVVPTAYRVVAMNGCHRDAGHQGQQEMLPLVQDQFGSLAWQCECRRWSVAMKGVFSMRLPKPRVHYKIFWSPLLGAASYGFHWHWNEYETGPTTTCSECFGLLLPHHETRYGICDSWSDCKNIC